MVLLALSGFFATVVAAMLIIAVNVRIMKRKLPRWDASATMLFVGSMGRFGEANAEKWTLAVGCSEEGYRTIIRYQLLCLLEMVAAYFATVLLILAYLIWVQQAR
jgi:hypothetical protein